MQPKRTIKADEMMGDLRSGMSVSQLIDKYNISLKSLRFVFQSLLNAGVMTRKELNAQAALYRNTADLKSVRNWLRTSTTFPVRVYDSGSSSAMGCVLDISEKGVCVKGIGTFVGEVKDFIVRSGAFGHDQKFVFAGKCRWVNTKKLFVKEWVAGFEITDISTPDLAELRKLIGYIDNQYYERRASESLNATFGIIY